MTRIGSTAVISRRPDEFVFTGADTESLISRGDVNEKSADDKWQNLLDQLVAWASQPDALADAGVEPPDGDTIQLAADVLQKLKENGAHPPDRIVRDPNGGIVIQYDGLPEHQFYVWDDGSVDFLVFAGTQLIWREAVV